MLLDRFKENIKKYYLIEQGDRIVVGVSGGADSICLLMCLYAIKDERNLRLVVAHINHGLRGEESDADEAFVREFCKAHGIDFFVKHADVRAYAKSEKLSEEEAGREIRYRFFSEVGYNKFGGSHKIAVAHNKNDQAETILFNIFRGCSINGLSGMHPKQDKIIRPLIFETRDEIENFLKEQGQSYRIDSSNLSCDYTRNKIRNKLIPFIESEINSGALDHIVDLGEEARQAEEILEVEIDKFRGKYHKKGDDEFEYSLVTEDTAKYFCSPYECNSDIVTCFDIDELVKSNEYVSNRIIYESICNMAGGPKDITRAHVESVLRLVELHNGAMISLPNGVVAKKIDDRIGIFRADVDVLKKITPNNRILEILNGDLKEARIFDYEKDAIIPENKYLKWFDYDRIQESMTWRFRETGDIIATSTDARKPLRKHMTDAKILPELRDSIPLLTDGKNIIWIYGGRISADYKITENTKRVIEIEVPEGLEKFWQNSYWG